LKISIFKKHVISITLLFQMTTYFISGHTNLTQLEFNSHYVPILNNLLNTNSKFVIGNSQGTDTMSLDYLLNHNISPQSITIYYFGKNYK